MDNKSRYLGSLCVRHPEGNGERYKSNKRCIACGAEARDKWKENNKAKAQSHVKKYKQTHKARINLAIRNKRRAEKGLPPLDWVSDQPLKPSAWVLAWEADHPGHRLTTDDIAEHLRTGSEVVTSYKKKIQTERMAAYRARKRQEQGKPPVVVRVRPPPVEIVRDPPRRYKFHNLELQFMSDKIDADVAVQAAHIRRLHGRSVGGTIGTSTEPPSEDHEPCEPPADPTITIAPPTSGGVPPT